MMHVCTDMHGRFAFADFADVDSAIRFMTFNGKMLDIDGAAAVLDYAQGAVSTAAAMDWICPQVHLGYDKQIDRQIDK